eukprot:scaffold1541_cov256-Pinguiococcus_pyrenoidosus.AAC.34
MRVAGLFGGSNVPGDGATGDWSDLFSPREHAKQEVADPILRVSGQVSVLWRWRREGPLARRPRTLVNDPLCKAKAFFCKLKAAKAGKPKLISKAVSISG